MTKTAIKRMIYCIPLDLIARLEALRKSTGAPASEHVRRALADYLTKQERARK